MAPCIIKCTGSTIGKAASPGFLAVLVVVLHSAESAPGSFAVRGSRADENAVSLLRWEVSFVGGELGEKCVQLARRGVAKSSAGHLMHKLKHKKDSFSPPAFFYLSFSFSDLAVRVSAQNVARQKGPREDREDRESKR